MGSPGCCWSGLSRGSSPEEEPEPEPCAATCIETSRMTSDSASSFLIQWILRSPYLSSLVPVKVKIVTLVTLYMPDRPMPAVKSLIERDGKYLLIATKSGDRKFWTLPGGRIEFGEEPLEALRREVREEVSVEVDVGEPLGMYTFFYGEPEKQVVLTVFSCSIEDGEIDIGSNPADENIVEHGWFSREELGDLALGKGVRDFVERRL